jgi:hypothetical protein
LKGKAGLVPAFFFFRFTAEAQRAQRILFISPFLREGIKGRV